MIIFYSTQISGNLAQLTGDESIHCSKVLRKKVNDEVYITDGKGSLFQGSISSISKKEVDIIIETQIGSQKKLHNRSIAIAPTKNIDRLEWFLEKSTEIGISNIYPFLSARSERKIIKPERLEKIIISAMKQSKNYHKPVLHPLVPYSQLVQMDFPNTSKFIAHCMDPKMALQHQYQSGEDAIVLIGPEGDFSENEVDMANTHYWKEVSLGKSRLRTETAGIVACHLLNL